MGTAQGWPSPPNPPPPILGEEGTCVSGVAWSRAMVAAGMVACREAVGKCLTRGRCGNGAEWLDVAGGTMRLPSLAMGCSVRASGHGE